MQESIPKTVDRAYVEEVLQLFIDKDLEGLLALFTDDAVMIDPHYPVPEMRGKAAIRQGMGWALKQVKQPGFTVRHVWIEDASGVLEVDTHHRYVGGMEQPFLQVFVFEARDGLLTRLQSYVPYRPPGFIGLAARITRVLWRLQGK